MGPGRSLHKLSQEQDQNETGGRRPALSTLKRWSREDGWEVQSAAFDVETAERAREGSLQRQASRVQERIDARLQFAAVLHRLAMAGLMQEEHDDGDNIVG